jgi:DNA-binding MarR family transcriptional regulator
MMTGQQIMPLIDHLARVGRRALDAALSDGLRPRHVVALHLLHERGPLPQHGLGEALCLDPSNVVGLLNELEERGLVERRRDRADRRRHTVSLSAAGSAELARAYTRLALAEDEMFSALSGDERATLHELLVRAVSAASPLYDGSPCEGPPCE